MEQNRRKFSRISFQTEARLIQPDGECVVDVLDLSLKGALIQPKSEMYVTVGTTCILEIRLDEDGDVIRMETSVVHHRGNNYGLACRDIDLDSITHLRRVVELNLGDLAMADREFAQLTES